MNAKLILMGVILMNMSVILAQTKPNTLVHAVTAKENLYRIALKYGTDIPHVMALNPGLKKESIKIGTKLIVPIPAGGMSAIIPGPATPPGVLTTANAPNTTTVQEIAQSPKATQTESPKPVTVKRKSLPIVAQQNESMEAKKSVEPPIEKITAMDEEPFLVTSAEERKNQLLNMAKSDHSIIVVTSTNEPKPLMAEVQEVAKPIAAKKVAVKSATKVPAEKQAYVDNRDLYNPPSAASLRRVLLAAERGEDMIVNLQIIMKDGAVICVTDPSLQLQMVSELLQAQK